jgi:hypothetical protein
LIFSIFISSLPFFGGIIYQLGSSVNGKDVKKVLIYPTKFV